MAQRAITARSFLLPKWTARLATTRLIPLSPRAYFIGKMPGNFHDVGFIHMILLNERIIEAQRKEMAHCFDNLKQLRQRTTRTAFCLKVWHEDTALDFENPVRRMFDFCRLRFKPGCLKFYKTERVVRAMSTDQVRQPIYREGLEQWRNYAP